MSMKRGARRGSGIALGIKVVLAILAIAVLAWLAVRIGAFTLQVLNTSDSGTETDPQFAEEAATVEPMDFSDDEDAATYEDNSANWDTSVQTPVDKTAEELGREAAEAEDE